MEVVLKEKIRRIIDGRYHTLHAKQEDLHKCSSVNMKYVLIGEIRELKREIYILEVLLND